MFIANAHSEMGELASALIKSVTYSFAPKNEVIKIDKAPFLLGRVTVEGPPEMHIDIEFHPAFNLENR